MKEISGEADFRALAAADKPFCAVFSADWCPDCQVLKAALPSLEEEFGDRYDFAIIDRDQYMNLAQEFDVMGIPSFVVLKNDNVIGTFISKFRKTRAEIASFLEETLTKAS